MPYNVLLFPLIGGYYLLSNFVFFKYKYQRISSQRLILNSALAGIILGLVSLIFSFLVQTAFPEFFDAISAILRTTIADSQPFLWTMLFGLFATIIFTHMANLVIEKIPGLRHIPIENAISNYGNELEQLCHDSIVHAFALQVTLKNDKVYVGFISETPIPSKTNYLLFTPLYSGYRDSSTKALTLNTSYGPVIESLIEDNLMKKLSIMNIVIKQDEILTMSPHDPDVFDRFS